MRTCFLIMVGMVTGAGCATRDAWPVARDSSSQGSQIADHGTATALEDIEPMDEAAFDELEEEFSQKQMTIADPLEPVNRVMHRFNDALYFGIVRPVTHTYADVVPKPARLGIRNFFHNVATPPRLVNCLLQGKGAAAGTEVKRFAINTTVGVLGFGDPARVRWGLEPAEEDLGQTLAVYGFGDGFYLVWPFLGPSNLRDSVGMLGDQFLNPIRYVEPREVSIGLSAASAVSEASLHIGEYESFKAAAVDPYVALRGAYLQYRKQQIQDGDRPPDPNSSTP